MPAFIAKVGMFIGGLQLIWPALCAVQDAQDDHGIKTNINQVRDQIRCAGYNKLARIGNTTSATQLWVVSQTLNRTSDRLVQA